MPNKIPNFTRPETVDRAESADGVRSRRPAKIGAASGEAKRNRTTGKTKRHVISSGEGGRLADLKPGEIRHHCVGSGLISEDDDITQGDVSAVKDCARENQGRAGRNGCHRTYLCENNAWSVRDSADNGDRI